MVANADNHNRIIDLLLRKGPWKRSKACDGESLWYDDRVFFYTAAIVDPRDSFDSSSNNDYGGTPFASM